MPLSLHDLPWRLGRALDLATPLLPAAALLLALAAAWLLARRRRRAALAAVALAALAAWGLGPVWRPPPAPGPAPEGAVELTLAVANLRRDNPEAEAALRALLALDPDLVALIETPPALRAALARPAEAARLTGAARATHVLRPVPRDMQLAVLSAPPARLAPRLRKPGGHPPSYAAIDLDLGRERGLRLLLLHFASPVSPNHQAQLRWIPRLARFDAPRLAAAGDLNAPSWGRAPAALARTLGLRPAGGWRPSWAPRLGPLAPLTAALRPWLGLPLDQTLTGPGVRVLEIGRLAVPGSDHLAQVIRLRVDPPKR